MKRVMLLLLAIMMTLSLGATACAESEKRVAKDGAQVQTDDSEMPTRMPPENGTKILRPPKFQSTLTAASGGGVKKGMNGLRGLQTEPRDMAVHTAVVTNLQKELTTLKP